MSVYSGPEISNENLVLCLDAANPKSYSGSGVTWYDLSGNNRNATLFNTVQYSTSNNGVMNFQRPAGVQGYATIPTDATISSEVFGISTTFTLSAWVYPREYVDYAPLIAKAFGGSYSNTTAGLWVESGNNLRFVVGANVGSNPAGSSISVSYTAQINTWYNMVGVADGINIIMYINGVSVGSTLLSGITIPRSENGSPITIGTRSTANTPELNALVGPISIYNRGLSALEVQQNFNALRGRFGI